LGYYDKYMVPDVPEGTSGDWVIKKFTVSETDSKLDMIMSHSQRYVPAGTYTGLYRGRTIIMSDTPDEICDHSAIILESRGKVLIVGLGLGVVLNSIAQKPETTSVTVIEKSEDVLNLVKSHYENKYPGKIEFIHADIFDYKPKPTDKWDFVWFDIWDNLCVDNLKEMATLHRKYGKKATWKASWGKEILQYEKRRMGYYG
jgi:hypothetical protein